MPTILTRGSRRRTVAAVAPTTFSLAGCGSSAGAAARVPSAAGMLVNDTAITIVGAESSTSPMVTQETSMRSTAP